MQRIFGTVILYFLYPTMVILSSIYLFYKTVYLINEINSQAYRSLKKLFGIFILPIAITVLLSGYLVIQDISVNLSFVDNHILFFPGIIAGFAISRISSNLFTTHKIEKILTYISINSILISAMLFLIIFGAFINSYLIVSAFIIGYTSNKVILK